MQTLANRKNINSMRRSLLRWTAPVVTYTVLPVHAQSSEISGPPENSIASFDCTIPSTFTETIDSASGIDATFTIVPNGSEFSIRVEQSNGVVYEPVNASCPANIANSRILSLSNGPQNPIIRIVSGNVGQNTFYVVVE